MRARSIAIRDELTDEWKKRGVKEQREYAILTAEISKATFGLTPTEYAEFKKLKRENLGDHMTDLELIFSMLGEAATTEIARNRDARGMLPNQVAAHDGGDSTAVALQSLYGRGLPSEPRRAFHGATCVQPDAGALQRTRLLPPASTTR